MIGAKESRVTALAVPVYCQRQCSVSMNYHSCKKSSVTPQGAVSARQSAVDKNGWDLGCDVGCDLRNEVTPRTIPLFIGVLRALGCDVAPFV